MELAVVHGVSPLKWRPNQMRPLILASGLSIAFLVVCLNTEGMGETSAPSQTTQPPEQDKAAPAQNGKEEPSAKSNPAGDQGAVFVNGALNVPGAPKDSQTEPAKFSSRNDAFDKLPIIAAASHFSDAEKSRIVAALRNTKSPVVDFDGKPTAEVPFGIPSNDIPDSIKLEIPSLKGLKYIQSSAAILLIDPTNSVVIDKIASNLQ